MYISPVFSCIYIDDIKLIGVGCENDTCTFFKVLNATKDPHFLLECIQLLYHVHKLELRKCQLSLMGSQQILCATDHTALV